MIKRTHPDADSTDSIDKRTTLISTALTTLLLLSVLAPAVARVPDGKGLAATTHTRVTGPDGTRLANDSLWSFEANAHRHVTTDETGAFSLSSDGTVGFYQRSTDHYWQRDGVTDLYAIEHTGGVVGNVTVPRGNVLDVRVLDADGDPVSGVDVQLSDYATGSNVSVGIHGKTDSKGFYRANGAPFTGLEVVGTVSVTVQPPATQERFVQRQYRRNLSVTDATMLTIRLDEGEETTDVTGELWRPDGTPPSGTVGIRTTRSFGPMENRSFALNDSGGFTASVPFNDQTDGLTFHDLVFSQNDFQRDGVPDLFAVERFDGTRARHFDRRLPPANVTTVSVTDDDGTPVPNASVTVIHRSATGSTASKTFETDESGRLVAGGTTGLELTGRVTVLVSPPDSNRFVGEAYRDRIVRDPTHVTISLEEAPPDLSDLSAPNLTEIGDSFSFSADASGAVSEFRWDFDGDGTTDEITAEPTVRHTYRTIGTPSPVVTAVDDDGVTATANTTISVVDTRAPNADLSGPKTTAVGVPTEFSAENTTDAGTIARYVWDLGNGTTVETTSATISHTFETVGTRSVRVTAYDGAGNADSATFDVPPTESPAVHAATDHWFVNTCTAKLDYDVANANGASVEYSLDGGVWQPASRPVMVSGLDPGDHSVALRLADGSTPLSHESAFDTAVVTVDTEPPALVVDATRKDVRPGTPIAVTTSDAALSDVSYRTNRSRSGTLADTSRIDTTGWPPNPTTVVVTARDRAGNVREERAVYDFTPDLEIRSFQPANDTRIFNPVVSATFARGDAVLFVNGQRVASRMADTSITAPLTDLAPGNYTVRLVVSDAGHTVSETRTFEIVGVGGGGGGGGGGFSEPIVSVVTGHDGTAIDVLNSRDGVTTWADLTETETNGVRFTTLGIEFDRNDASTAVTLRARSATDDAPANSLAVLDLTERYVRSGDVDSATVRFTVSPDELPGDAALSDVVVYQRDHDEWRKRSTVRDGRTVSVTVPDFSTIAVVIEGEIGTESETNTRTVATNANHETNVATPTTVETAVTGRTSATPATQEVRSDGQPGFGFVVVVIALVIIARERQPL